MESSDALAVEVADLRKRVEALEALIALATQRQQQALAAKLRQQPEAMAMLKTLVKLSEEQP